VATFVLKSGQKVGKWPQKVGTAKNPRVEKFPIINKTHFSKFQKWAENGH
jgi:hypothetical protein